MILQALYDYYERKAKLGEIAPIGFEWKKIPFLIVINKNGEFKRLEDTREDVAGKLVAKSFLVPQSVGRSGKNAWKKTFLLWDHYGYVLGYPKGDALKDRRRRNKLLGDIQTENEFLLGWKESEQFLAKLALPDLNNVLSALQNIPINPNVKALIKNVEGLIKAYEDSKKQLGTFIGALKTLPENIKMELSIQAILQFYETEQYKKVPESDNWMDCAGVSGANLSFQLEGENRLILSNTAVTRYQEEQTLKPQSDNEKKALCLITGIQDYIERLHEATPIKGGQATGKLVGFQKDRGFDSYGKTQAFNAPVGRYAQKAYTTALNTLIQTVSNKAIVGDTTVLFWAERPTIVEQTMPFVLTKPRDDPDRGSLAVKQLLESIRSGILSAESEKRFYVLGLSPNAARIAVRYWVSGTVAEFASHIIQHFDDLEIVHDNDAPEFFALSSMLSHTALEYKMSNVAPNTAGQVTEAVFKGIPYPLNLLHSTIRRIRAEQHITRIRAAIIKASINRFNRFYNKNKEEELTVALDKTNRNSAYLLGRLFAVLEKVQYRALAIETIRERYYGAFSSTPVTVFPQLMKLKNHHLDKLTSGKHFFENLIGEIVDGLDGSGTVPRQLSLEEQGRFAIGYYHQRQDLKFKEGKNTAENTEEKTND
ncbi:MAG: type I-C CRISPR-associated protein Cas8c/Csd1 [Desulfobacter postgatei]|uniref:Type I-C CRISPR-associated protein Cas8c/Csd1 n=1 Tax=Desulfobacter postgatei TaxID=2293 RepID=A0A2G6MRY0_9BACT|nr:MAG: type I-C CRISPR-associated protein Cas8c/Csd1 [Desulfobacter postgatei]